MTSKKLTDYGLDIEMSSGRIERLPKLNYFDFIALLGRVNYVVTDSGGLQQECAITGHPCLVHRLVTESFEGVGENVVISGLEIPVVNDFLRNPSLHRRGGQSPDRSPTQVIITDLGSRGYLEKSKRP